jgi:superfamily II DNA/RNA helicase
MIRHAPELADSVGLLIYDEAHQFDSGVRGVTYELLLSSLKRLIPSTVQTVLISAVISNATEIANWIGKEVEVVSGTNLHPTYRTLAFSEWKDPKGRLNFVDIENPEKLEYFVPRLIEQKALSKNPREKERIFPNKDSGPDIAIYLGIKMVPKGSVAIFCGTKKTVASICNRIVELKDRNYESSYPNSYSNMEELKKLTSMISKHFGVSNSLTICSELGIFAHSGNTPQGLRLAIEYAMQKGLVKYVVCTSTLAQGVNLPIKYLVITSIYQGVDKISTRDFHNLIGRAGRSGIHTEGSIIFADPEVYDQKESYSNSSKWKSVKSLLDAQTTKPCVSTILEIFNPLLSDSGQYIQNVRPMDYVNYYVNNQGNLSDIADKMAKKYNRVGFSIENLQRQILDKFSIITAIESYLMAYSNENSSKLEESEVVDLAKATLAYHSSATEFRANIVDLFIKISDQINLFYNDGKKRKTFGKTLFGVKDLLHIEKWAMDNYGNLLLTESSQDLLESFWPIISQKITNSTFKKITPTKNLFLLAQDWISGVSYNELYQSFISNKSKIIAGKQFRQPSIEKVVELCDNVFAFDATLIVAAVRETIEYNFPEDETNELSERINVFQKQLKYGLSSELAIIFHEIGFSDRVIAQEMENVKPKLKSKKSFVKRELRRNVKYRTIVDKFPSYYGIIYSELLKNAL